MAFFNLGKNKKTPKEGCCCNSGETTETAACDCGGNCEVENDGNEQNNARFIVLGACCKKSQETFENTKKAVAMLGFTDEVLNIGDSIEIAKYGVMQTPALVINGKVVSYGKFLKTNEIIQIIEKVVN